MLHDLSIQVPVIITKQGRHFVAYTPVLDISTSGKTEKEVKGRFEELVEIFFEEIIQAGTTHDVLSELGWRKEQKKWMPPKLISTKSIGLRLPAFA